MTELLPNYVAGRWQSGSGASTPLFDPVLGTELARVDATGLDLPAAFAFAREQGGNARHLVVIINVMLIVNIIG